MHLNKASRRLGAAFVASTLLLCWSIPIHAAGKAQRSAELVKQQEQRRKELRETIRRCAPKVSEDTMQMLTHVESAWHPYQIGLNKEGHKLAWTPRTKAEAIVTANDLILKGYKIDMGFAQISRGNQLRFGISMEDIFDECINLGYAQMILSDCYARARRDTRRFKTERDALYGAFSCYNTGNFTRGFTNGYVGKVLRAPQLTAPGSR